MTFTGASQYTLPRCNPTEGHLCAAIGYQVYCATDADTSSNSHSAVSDPIAALGCEVSSTRNSRGGCRGGPVPSAPRSRSPRRAPLSRPAARPPRQTATAEAPFN